MGGGREAEELDEEEEKEEELAVLGQDRKGGAQVPPATDMAL